MALVVPALFATVALPAMAPPSSQASQSSTASELETLKKSGEQTVTVAEEATAESVARDGYSATTPEELAAAKSAAAAKAAEAQRASNAANYQKQKSTYNGPSAKDYVNSPAYPKFSLSAVFSVAKQYLGVPYVYGGATPAGFDCSGLVMFVYAQFGVQLAHSVSAQGAAGTRISIADAVPGDLVIMNGHDGFYAGNGMILDAPRPGKVVQMRKIWTSNYYIVRIGI